MVRGSVFNSLGIVDLGLREFAKPCYFSCSSRFHTTKITLQCCIVYIFLFQYCVFRSGKDGAPKDYYTLECLLFLLKHVSLTHPTYVRKAAVSNKSALSLFAKISCCNNFIRIPVLLKDGRFLKNQPYTLIDLTELIKYYLFPL